MKKQYFVAGFNALLMPIALLVGFELGKENYPAMFVFLFFGMALEFIVTFLWLDINKEIHVKK